MNNHNNAIQYTLKVKSKLAVNNMTLVKYVMKQLYENNSAQHNHNSNRVIVAKQISQLEMTRHVYV